MYVLIEANVVRFVVERMKSKFFKITFPMPFRFAHLHATPSLAYLSYRFAWHLLLENTILLHLHDALTQQSSLKFGEIPMHLLLHIQLIKMVQAI